VRRRRRRRRVRSRVSCLCARDLRAVVSSLPVPRPPPRQWTCVRNSCAVPTPRGDDHDGGGRLLLLSDAMCLLSVDDRVRSNGLGLDGDARAKKLNEIENDYESIFSWNVKRLTGISQNLMADLIDVAREKMEIVAVEDGVFSFNRFSRDSKCQY